MSSPTSVDRIVITADQRGSRRSHDAVPATLAGLADRVASIRPVLAFERTVGDELQGVVADGSGAVAAATCLVRLGGWRIGLGIGAVQLPLPASTRAARGAAFIAAREAVEAARRSPVDLALRTATSPPGASEPTVVGADRYGSSIAPNPDDAAAPARHAETALWLLTGLLQRRTQEGWDVVEGRDRGESGREAARRLGVSDSAVSQRLRRAGYDEGVRGAQLCAALIDRCLRP